MELDKMALDKKTLSNIIIGWEMIKEYNKNNTHQITKEEFIEAYLEVTKEDKEFCVNCIVCKNCNII